MKWNDDVENIVSIGGGWWHPWNKIGFTINFLRQRWFSDDNNERYLYAASRRLSGTRICWISVVEKFNISRWMIKLRSVLKDELIFKTKKKSDSDISINIFSILRDEKKWTN